MEGLDDIGLTLRHEEDITAFEQKRPFLDAEDAAGPHRRHALRSHPFAACPLPATGRAGRSGMVSRSGYGRAGRPSPPGKDTMSLHIPRVRRPLDGEITVRGAKNLVSKAMVAALLGTSPSVLRSVPDISDVRIVSNLLSIHGVKIEHDVAGGELRLIPERRAGPVADIDAHAGSSRIPILFCGPLPHRLGEAIILTSWRSPHRRPADQLPLDVLRSRRPRRQAGWASTSPRRTA